MAGAPQKGGRTVPNASKLPTAAEESGKKKMHLHVRGSPLSKSEGWRLLGAISSISLEKFVSRFRLSRGPVVT